MAKSAKKQSSISRLLLRGGVLVVAGYLVVGLVSNQMQIQEKQQELLAAQEKLAVQQQQNDELSRVLESGTDLEIIERVARDQYGYAKPNERIFVDITGK